MFSVKLANVLLTIAICHSAVVSQSSVPVTWQKVNVDRKFTFSLPSDMKQSKRLYTEDIFGEYTNGRVVLVFVHQPFGFLAYDRRRANHLKDYQETETQIDGRKANVRTFYTVEKDSQKYVAELVLGNWAEGKVELRMSLVSNNSADLDVAKRIFTSVDFP